MQRRILDILMLALSVVLMGGVSLFEHEGVHKRVGIALALLWIFHNILNRHFYKNLCRGKYRFFRILTLAVNLGIAVCAVLLVWSGVVLSPKLLDVEFGFAYARTVHLVASHWYYVLIAVHFAMHAGAFFSRISLFRENATAKWTFGSVVLALSVCGVRAVYVRGFFGYLFYAQKFFFLDLERGVPHILFDTFSIFVLLSSVTWLLLKIPRRAKFLPRV